MQRMQLRAARAILEWSQEDLAAKSGVSLPTIKRLEPGMGPINARPDTIERLRTAFEGQGIEFVHRPHVGVVLHVATAVADIVQGRRCVVIHTSPDEPALALSIADALEVARDSRERGESHWANALEEAAKEAETLPLA